MSPHDELRRGQFNTNQDGFLGGKMRFSKVILLFSILSSVIVNSFYAFGQTNMSSLKEVVVTSSKVPLWTWDRPDGHAPIGVMGDHTHNEAEVMVGYRYMYMHMDGLRDGAKTISSDAIRQAFMVSPIWMTMEMHMPSIMYAPNDNVTFASMFPYVRKKMSHKMRNGRTFTIEAGGFGDIQLSVLYKIFDQDIHRVHFNGGISLPTGSVSENDATLTNGSSKLPYPMQLGSGTFDLLPGITYLAQTEDLSWGVQAKAIIRTGGENSQEYRFGNRALATTWTSYRFFNWLSSSLRYNWEIWGNVEGEDPSLNKNMVPTADPDNQGGNRMDVLMGLNIYPSGKVLKGLRLFVEYGVPLYQNLRGPQMEVDHILTGGCQYTMKF